MIRMPGARVLILAMLTASPAAAADWHYCLAPSQNGPVVYMTGLFTTAADTSAVEADFTAALNNAGYTHEDVQCPRADSKAAVADMQQYAVSFNADEGNKVIRLRWRPTR